MTLAEKLATFPNLAQDLDHWADYGVSTVEDFDRYMLETTIWDLYKDVHGIRPRFMDFSTMSIAELSETVDSLCEELEVLEDLRAADQAEAVQKFEKHVTNTICMGARDRETALRWIMDSTEAGGDWEYFCFLHGLPYAYFRVAA